MSNRSAVILIDHRTRDLMLGVLLAHHLEALGVTCHLEPLESYHGALAAFAPDLILFNHINSSHLVRYSRRLAQLNVLTAVLPNEGIIFDEDDIRYNSGKYHKGSHIDFFFCWNEKHRAGLLETGLGAGHTRVEVCGVPRFDFYFEPWSRLYRPSQPAKRQRPLILLCTNLAFARFHGLADADVDRFFAPWKDRLLLYRDYRSLIQVQVREREKLLAFVRQLAACGKFDLVLRPHPREESSFYARFIAGLDAEQQRRIRLDDYSNITDLILACDLEISCETCTTALEAWIARKPTVELVFERHPLFFHEETARLNVLCENPEQIVEAVSAQLRDPSQAAHAEGRRCHLAAWCASPEGNSAKRIAGVLAEAIHAKPPVKREFTIGERRKGAKLKLLRKVDLPYSFNPLLPLKARLFPKNYASKDFTYRKTIRPSDVADARARLQAALADRTNPPAGGT
jgi:surface carbohydrate biosynthesis protein